MIGLTWTGWDGSVWDLYNGPVYLQGGIEKLLSMLDADEFLRETALTDGQSLTGWRAKARTGLLPVLIGQGATELEWLALDRAWWRTMRPDRPGTLTVTAPDGEQRRLKLRFSDDGGMPLDRDPTRDRLTIAPLKMVADDPWWLGKTFDKTFRNGDAPVNFFGGDAGLGTPFIIGSSNTVANATITNPGDIPTWPRYEVAGPQTEFSVAVNGKRIAGTINLNPGDLLTVDTSPQRQSAMLKTADGKVTNVIRNLSAINFAPIPDGATINLDIRISGAGSIKLLGDPRYYKAW